MNTHKNLRILFISGKTRYMLVDANDPEPEAGQVLNLSQKTLFSPFPIVSLISQGYWEPYTGSQSILPGLLAQVSDESASDDGSLSQLA